MKLLSIFSVFIFAGCKFLGSGNDSGATSSKENSQDKQPIVYDIDFSKGDDHKFFGIFRDVPLEKHENYRKLVEEGKDLGPVPPESWRSLMGHPAHDSHWLMNAGVYDVADHAGLKGYLLQGVNRSDDMDKYMVRRFQLKPDTQYRVKLSKVNVVANDPFLTAGPGGGVARAISASAISLDPNLYVLDYNKQILFSPEVRTAIFNAEVRLGGTAVCKTQSYLPLPNVPECIRTPDRRIQYMTVVFDNVNEMKVRTNSKGEFWLMIGGHSGHEGLDEFYVTKMGVEINEM